MNVAGFATLFDIGKIKSHPNLPVMKERKKRKIMYLLHLSCLTALQLHRVQTKPHCSKNYNHKMEEKEKIWKKEGMESFLLQVSM